MKKIDTKIASKEEQIRQMQAILAERMEQYTISITNGLMSNPNLIKEAEDIVEIGKKIIDAAYELAAYQLEKIYNQK